MKKPANVQAATPGTSVLEDGSLVISPAALARFGNGDATQGRKDLRMLLAAERESPNWSGPTELPKSVRIAGPADEAALLALLKLDLADNAEHVAMISEDRVMAHIQTGTRQRGGMVGVIGPIGAPVACIILVPTQWWWSNSWYMMEVVNFVHPDHRKSRHADDLLNFAKWVSDDLSRRFGYRTMLVCGVLGAWRVRAKMALYARKFWTAGIACVYPAPVMKGN